MTTTSLLKDVCKQEVKAINGLEITGVSKVETRKEHDSIIMTPLRKSWKSFADVAQADASFLEKRKSIIEF